MSADKAAELGLKPLVRIVSFSSAGVDPAIMGQARSPRPEMSAEGRLGGRRSDLVEANEAFAAQAMSVNKDLGWDTAKVNVSGGAISIGHPIGASGLRVLVTLLHGMQREKARKGLATLCIGGGQGSQWPWKVWGEMPGLENKVALITGGTGGIGSAICQRLADAGARIATTYQKCRKGGGLGA